MSVIAIGNNPLSSLSSVQFPEPSKGSAAGSVSGVNSSSTSAPPRAQQQAALNRLLAAYKSKLAQGQNANQLAALRQQITAAAKALGQNVQLPKSPSSSSEGSGGPATASDAPKALAILA